MSAARRLPLALILLAGVAYAAPAEKIGSWVLSCPDAEPCLLRLEKRFVDKAGITGELDILADGKALVPVLALRGLSSELLMAAALAGHTEASLQFAGGPRETLDCAPATASYVCAPRDEAADRLAAALPSARSVTVRITVAISGLKPLPVQEKSLDLTGTGAALTRLRAAGPAPVPGAMTAVTEPSPDALMGMADRALKAAGYPNGVADLQALVAKYRGK